MKYIKKLSKEEKESLNKIMKNTANARVRNRAHAILLSNRRYSINQLADIFMVDRDTVSDWISRWLEFGSDGLQDSARSGRPRKESETAASDE